MHALLLTFALSVQSAFSGLGPVQQPITFSGSGCKLAPFTQVDVSDWSTRTYFTGFDITGIYKKTCEVQIPLNLMNGCLDETAVINHIYNELVQDAHGYVTTRLSVDGFDLQPSTSTTLYRGLARIDNALVIKSPPRRFCGNNVNLRIYTEIGIDRTGNYTTGYISIGEQDLIIDTIRNINPYIGDATKEPDGLSTAILLPFLAYWAANP